MEVSDQITFFAVFLSVLAFILSYLTFKREQKKSNEDILYQEKINAYKDIVYEAKKIYHEYYIIVNALEKDHSATLQSETYLNRYFEKAYEFDNLISKFIILLPNTIYTELDTFSDSLTEFLSEISLTNPHENKLEYKKLKNQLSSIISLIRSDINIDELTIELNDRIK